MNTEEILEEAKLAAEMIAEELSQLNLPLEAIKICKSGNIPSQYKFTIKNELDYTSRKIAKLIIKVNGWKDTLDSVEHGELFFKRHMVNLMKALRSIRKDVDEARTAIRDSERRILKIPEWMKPKSE